MKALKKAALWIDSFFESFSMTALLAMILIVTTQVLTRKLFNFVLFWSEEVTLLLLVWFSFLGIAFGFREHLHLAIDTFTSKFSPKVNWVLDRIIYASTFAFGVYLILSGTEFTILMNESTLAATKLPNSVIYAVMPITGLLICVYSLLQFMGIDTRRHRGIEEGSH
ncbi:TRAP transporter small permease [Paenibacillus sp. RC67]|uniref:TRAP transporter small permease n=1 Tax=Paenibacillus sp. RC67 TaxID=3039392 RepID=UPI0024AD429B|nr:TRAP transporter small permease [Paenibacillus sp. RC67]